jgi:hypothetical protein
MFPKDTSAVLFHSLLQVFIRQLRTDLHSINNRLFQEYLMQDLL